MPNHVRRSQYFGVNWLNSAPRRFGWQRALAACLLIGALGLSLTGCAMLQSQEEEPQSPRNVREWLKQPRIGR